MKVCIVIPTYNEAQNILNLINAIQSATGENVSVLVVDDGSPDGTGGLVRERGRTDQRVKLLQRTGKMGLGSAYVAGFKEALKDTATQAVIEMDADFSHNPGSLPQMLQTLSVADVAVGSRYVTGGGTENWSLGRRILSRGGSLYSRLILGAPIADFTGGFNGWRREVLESLQLDTLKSDGYSFQIELKYRAFLLGYRIKEFPILFSDRLEGVSKMNRSIVLEALLKVWSFRFAKKHFLEGARTKLSVLILALLCGASSLHGSQASAPIARPVFIVDKATNTLIVSDLKDGVLEEFERMPVTLGRVAGDKESEGDLKTPEGIYTFRSRQTPPKLAPRFGVLAFEMNYPNAYDQMAGRTGNSIMLHATDEARRTDKKFDSEGCVVVSNENISRLDRLVRLQLTPILVFDKFGSEWLQPGKDERLKKFFNSWVSTWSGKNLDSYMDHYHSDFAANGLNKDQWRDYKTTLTKKYATIDIELGETLSYRHPKYSMITFVQKYRGLNAKGQPLFRSTGTKVLYIAEEGQALKIISEHFGQAHY